MSIDFTPQTTGPISSTATFTDNALNSTAPATQSVNLQGSGLVPVTVGTSISGLSFSVDGTMYTSTQTFAWVVGSSHTLTTTSPQTPVAGTQYTFASWSDGTLTTTDSVTAPLAGSTGITYTANFNTSYLLTLSVSPGGGGTVSPTSGSYYPAGNPVSIMATANTGYVFNNWTGSSDVVSASSASTTINMNSPETVTANFTLSAPTLSISPPSLNFGTVYEGQSSTKNVTVTNNGPTPVSISNIQITGLGNDVGDYRVSSNCPIYYPYFHNTLGVGRSCTVYVTFDPDQHETIFSPTAATATLTITDNATGSPQTVSLSAYAINPQASLNPNSLTFSTQRVGTTSTAKTVTLTNTGNTTLTLGTVSISGDFAIASGTTCVNSGTVAASANCVINVTFKPTRTGTRNGNLNITNNALSSPQTVNLSGKGD